MNVVILVSDALRAINLGCYGYDKQTSPEIDRIASQAVRFSHAFCTINSTDPSFTTIFTGKYPLSHGLRHHAHKLTALEKSYTSNIQFLPEILQAHHYTTIGLDWLGKWHKRGYEIYGAENIADGTAGASKPVGRAAGFNLVPGKGDWYYHLPERARSSVRALSRWWTAKTQGEFSRKRRPALSDSTGLTDMAIEHIRRINGKQPFLLFVHYWDNHIPYTAPRATVKSFLQTYDYPQDKTATVIESIPGRGAAQLIQKTTRGRTPETIGEIMAHYDASIRYVDGNVGRIYNTLAECDLLDDTLLIITGDHGESMNEHQIYFDHHGLYDPEVRIPLILSHGDLPRGKVYQEFVQHFDLVPTILDLAGIPSDPLAFDGKSLLRLVRGEPWDRPFVYAEEHCGQKKRMIRDAQFKYIAALDDEPCAYCERYHSREDEFYDLRSDPGETRNIIQDPEHEKYKTQLAHFIASLNKPQQGDKVEFDDEEETNRRLKALGYL